MRTKERAVYLSCLFFLFCLSAQVYAEDANACSAPQGALISQLMASVPSGFPRFVFANCPEQADLLSHFLWYHFHHRLGNSAVMFNKEYLLTADIWLGNAFPRDSQERIQDVHRRALLEAVIDDEGYVSSHQHFSQAYDLGWPFPSWGQAHRDLAQVKGKTAGWHFQPMKNVRGWIGGHLRASRGDEYTGQTAASLWELDNVKSLGIQDDSWRLEAIGPSPAVTTPDGYDMNALDAPYLQLRWTRTGKASHDTAPYVEWLGENDTEYSAQRQVYFYPDRTPLSKRYYHSIMTMYRHPLWKGKIKRIRISLAPGESDVKFEIDSFFTVYDTRHTINNPILILASCLYFNWTGDLDFLRRQIDRMRLALRYQQTVMGGLQYHHIRNPWPGHDGLPSWKKDGSGNLTFNSGHGIGSNYWDILPFGWDDLYATNQYYAATLAMAEMEEAIRTNPGWDIPLGTLALDPEPLRRHACEVKEAANQLFWNERDGRFVACIDQHGDEHDYGYTFLNLDAIWYDLATRDHAKQIMTWITGDRIVPRDTSTGADIYRWRFGPRATTRRNVEWYGQGWWAPESLDWGYQVQDGGAVLGFTFYDLWARLHILGPDDAWERLKEILAWEKDVQSEGGYRKYYEGGKRGTTQQGGGTSGGLGIDYEFYESSLLPAIIPYGFLGLRAGSDNYLAINPRLPRACPEMAISDFLYHDVRFDIRASNDTIELNCRGMPTKPIRIALQGIWRQADSNWSGSVYLINEAGVCHLNRCD